MNDKRSVFKTQCATFAIARQLTDDNRICTPISDSTKPPFCLRILKEHRTPEIQAFRNQVANEARKLRA